MILRWVLWFTPKYAPIAKKVHLVPIQLLLQKYYLEVVISFLIHQCGQQKQIVGGIPRNEENFFNFHHHQQLLSKKNISVMKKMKTTISKLFFCFKFHMLIVSGLLTNKVVCTQCSSLLDNALNYLVGCVIQTRRPIAQKIYSPSHNIHIQVATIK